MQQPAIQSFFDPGICTVTHVVSDPATLQAAIINGVRYLKIPINLR